MAYNFVGSASRTGVSDNRETQYAFTGALGLVSTVYFDPANNTSNVFSINNIIANEDGIISLRVSAGPNNTTSNGLHYLGAMSIEAVPEPGSAFLLGLGILLFIKRRRR